MGINRKAAGLFAGVAVLFGAGAALADEDTGNTLAWSSASASVGVCQVGVTCGQPNGIAFLRREQFSVYDSDFNNASVYPGDYAGLVQGAYFGQSYASAEAGDGLLGLPVLHAVAASGAPGLGQTPNPFIGVSVGTVQAVQGYTNTSETNLLIPLNAFQGLVDFHVNGAPGIVSAGLAVTTSAILDPAVAALWSAQVPGRLGEFSAGCGTSGALAFGQSGPTNVSASPNTQYLGVAATACGDSDTFVLAPNETFYVWARLGVVHTAIGVTDAGNTFNVTIAPEYQQQVQDDLAPALQLSGGQGLDIAVAGVPEPDAWALMIVGFGAIGGLLRRRNAGPGLGRLA